MIVAGRLFVVLGIFGLVAGAVYYAWNADDPELAGVGLLGAFFVACIYLGLILLRASPASARHRGEPDTGLVGSAHPDRGAADEHGNIHVMGPTLAPFVYSFAALVLLGGLVYRDKLGPWGIVLGLVAAVAGTAIWYRNVSADARAALHGGHGGHGDGGGAPLEGDLPEVPSGPPGPANWFEQLRQALEGGDPDWAAASYASDAVYYEPANPPHQGRDAIRAYLTDFLKGHRELRWNVQRMGVDGDVAIVEWVLSFRSHDRRVTDQAGVTVVETGPDGVRYHRDYL
jgi:uncharacterized protein (TIGR02246 family)